MDTLSNMLNQINNANMVSKPQVTVPFSIFKLQVARILQKKGIIEEVKKRGKGVSKRIIINLKYDNGEPAFSKIKRVSKSSQRIYKKSKEIKKIHQGYGIAIVSTSKGLMSDREAKLKKIGGEIICEIW